VEEEFSVSAGFHDGCRVLVVRGDVDELTAPALIESIDGEPDGWPLIVDLTAVTFIPQPDFTPCYAVGGTGERSSARRETLHARSTSSRQAAPYRSSSTSRAPSSASVSARAPSRPA
jgi:hypothetical protein